MLTIFLIIAVIILVSLWSCKKPKNFPPGPPCVPLLGSVPFLEMENFQFVMEELREKYGPVVGMKFGWRDVVAICGKKEVEEALRRDEFQGRPDFSSDGKGIMFSDGDYWQHQRRFTVRHLRDFGFGKNSAEDVILGEVDDFFKHNFETKRIVQVSGLFNTSAVNVLWAMMGGKRYSYDDPEFHHLLDCLMKRFRSGSVRGNFVNRHPFLAKFLPFLKIVRQEKGLDKLLKGFFTKAFKEHRLTREDEPRDLIDVYLLELDSNPNLHSSFSELTLRNVCQEFFSAGAESVGNSLGFALMYLVLYPRWQDEIHEEIVSVIGRERKPSLQDRKSMPKVEAFLTEVSRCNTIAAITVPHMCLEDTTFNGYTIPKECMLIISLWSILQDKEYWGDPENFRPERFLDANGLFTKDKSVPIFGAGKRVCPGETLARSLLFLFFTSMLQQYQFKLPEGHPKPSTVCLSGFTQAPRPFELEVTRRP